MTTFTDDDRKLITQHDVKLTEMCKTLVKIDKKLDKLDDKIDDNNKVFVTRKLFLSVNGIIIALLISLFAYTANIDKQVVKNTVCIEFIQEKIER